MADHLPETHEPGIYFGMPEAEYHADPSIGSGDLKRLHQSAADYWWASPLNPERERGGTPAMAWGRAFHKLVLEGETAFAESFAVEPDPRQFKGLLVTADDLKAFCKERGEKISGTKSELLERVRKHDTAVPVWDEIVAAFKAEAAGRETLSIDKADEIRRAADQIGRSMHLARAFSGGMPEVSVFWVDDGVPCKARLDYLKPRAILDLKRIANERRRPLDIAIRIAIAEYRYDIQARHYLDGYAALLEHARAGRVHACPLPKGWQTQMAPAVEMSWIWVFHQASGAPVTRAVELKAAATTLGRASSDIAVAKARWRESWRRFGHSEWTSDEPIAELTADDLPPWLRDETAPALPAPETAEVA